MHDSPVARYLAEFVGTFALLLFGGGSAVFSLEGVDPLSRVVLVSLSFGFILLALAYALGDISGGHFNPAVSVAALLAKRMSPRDFVPYLIAQIVGGLAGISVVYGVISGGPSLASSAAKAAALGSQCYAGSGAPAGCGFTLGSVFLLEAALTFVFIFVILRVTSSKSNTGGRVALHRHVGPLRVVAVLDRPDRRRHPGRDRAARSRRVARPTGSPAPLLLDLKR
jgi:aquaporin Z